MNIKEITLRIKEAIDEEVSKKTDEKYWITHYGANDIHPKHLVYWICVQSDKEKKRLQKDERLYQKLRSFLDDFEYPPEGRDGVHIGFESRETVDRESDGNWFYHWK